MRYFHVPKDQISDDQVRISGTQLHHLINVLRLHEGDNVTILDGSGGIYEVVITSISSHPPVAIGKIKARQQAQPPQVKVTLFQGLPKASKMDMIIQKATELGVYQIVPILCQNTVPNLSREREQQRVARWRQIAVEASKQSRRPFFPPICSVMRFDVALEEFHADLKLIFVAPSADFVRFRGLKDVLKQNATAKEVAIFIGPEGDFTEDEVQRALSAGVMPVSLGSNILRTETAAIAALTIVLYEQAGEFS